VAQLLVEKQRPRDAIVVLRDGIRRHPEALEMIEYLASLLSSHPDDNIRNGEEAVALASSLSEAYDRKHISSLLTLAGAFAETGRFDAAVRTAERALALAESAEADLLISKTRQRLALFRAGQPYRLPLQNGQPRQSVKQVQPDGADGGAINAEEGIHPTDQ